jgi:hypothetical protein
VAFGIRHAGTLAELIGITPPRGSASLASLARSATVQLALLDRVRITT